MAVEETDVVVVGAGVAGLVAARELSRAGHSVLVLEARDRVGGRLLAQEVHGTTMELGGQWIAAFQDASLKLVAELGLEVFSRYREGEDLYVGDDRRARRHAPHAWPLGPEATAAFDRACARLEELVATIDPDAPWQHPDAKALDQITFDEWLRREVPEREARDLVRLAVADAYMTKPAHAFSALGAGWLLASAGRAENLMDPNLILDQRVVGGYQQVPARLAAELGDAVRLGRAVRRMSWSDDLGRAGSVVVETTSGSVRARRVVVAVPPNLWSTLVTDPVLPAWRLQLEQQFSQGTVFKVQAAYDRPFWRDHGLSGTGFGPDLLVHEVYDNCPPDDEMGVLVGFVAGTNAARVSQLQPAERQEAVLDSLAMYFGDEARSPRFYVDRDWAADPWTRGAYGATLGTGAITRFGEQLRAPVGPLHFASADLAGAGFMHVDGAIRSGRRAAADVSAQLRG